jgi:hypothetical protein
MKRKLCLLRIHQGFIAHRIILNGLSSKHSPILTNLRNFDAKATAQTQEQKTIGAFVSIAGANGQTIANSSCWR